MTGVVTSMFFLIAFTPVFEASLRFNLMISIAIFAAAVFILKLKHVFKFHRILFFSVILLVLFIVFAHNYFYPPVSEYAANKRIYFYFIFLTCGLLLPFATCETKNLKSLIIGLVIVSIVFGVVAYFGGETENIRRRALELNPILHSKLLMFPLLLLMVSPGLSRQNFFLLLISVMCVGATIYTGSRGTLVALSATAVIYFIIRANPKEIFRLVIAGLVSVFTFINLLPLLPPDLAKRFTLESILDQGDSGDRPEVLSFALKTIYENPFGIGMGNMDEIHFIRAPHNVPIEAMLDLGVIASLPFQILLFWALFASLKGFRSPKKEIRFFSTFYLYMLFNSMIGGELTLASSLLYLPMGIVILADSSNLAAKSTNGYCVNLRKDRLPPALQNCATLK